MLSWTSDSKLFSHYPPPPHFKELKIVCALLHKNRGLWGILAGGLRLHRFPHGRMSLREGCGQNRKNSVGSARRVFRKDTAARGPARSPRYINVDVMSYSSAKLSTHSYNRVELKHGISWGPIFILEKAKLITD